MTLEMLKIKLAGKFPSLVIKDANEYSNSYEKGKSLWIPNSSEFPYTKKDSNTLTRSFYHDKYNAKKYDLEVYKAFNNFLEKHGYYASTEEYTCLIFSI